MIDNPAWWQKALDHYGIEDTQRTETDIVTRLLDAEIEGKSDTELYREAADTIERQAKEIDRLKAELDDWKKKALTKWMDSHD